MALLSSTKSKTVVGLDIEAGSIAATEVRANGNVQVVGHGVAPLPPGVFREGEVADPEVLGAIIKELFAEHKLSRAVRLGIANQRVAVRSMRLPAIDDRDELETAIRFQAQDHIPMPLDQAVLDWQVVGHSQTETGERRVEIVAVAARRDMLKQVMQALHAGGLRPIGIDHSAFGMIRALAREPGSPVGAAQFVEAPSYEERIGGHSAREPVAAVEGPSPARLYCNLGDVTNLAVARGSSCLFTRIAAFGVEGIAQKLAERRAAHPRARAPVAHPRRPRAAGRVDRGRPRAGLRGPRVPRRGRRQARRRAAPFARVLRRAGGCGRRSRGSSPAAPARRSRDWSSASSAISAIPSRSPGPPRSPTWTSSPPRG